jgi:hypothetical protein
MVKTSPSHPDLDSEKVEMHIKEGVQVTFQESALGFESVELVLGNTVNAIKIGIVPRFKPFFR